MHQERAGDLIGVTLPLTSTRAESCTPSTKGQNDYRIAAQLQPQLFMIFARFR